MTECEEIKPKKINYIRSRRMLELVFNNGLSCELSAEFLRVHSPSAEVRGHAASQKVLQIGKIDVQITAIKPVGHYAIQLVFDDGHDSGFYGWEYIHILCRDRDELWLNYLRQLEAAGASRDLGVQVIRFIPG